MQLFTNKEKNKNKINFFFLNTRRARIFVLVVVEVRAFAMMVLKILAFSTSNYFIYFTTLLYYNTPNIKCSILLSLHLK